MKKKTIKIIKQIILFIIIIATGLISCGDTIKYTFESKMSRIKIGLMTTAPDGIKNNVAAELLNILLDDMFSNEIIVDYLEPKTAADYQPNLESFARSGYELIFCTGTGLTDAVCIQAKRNPDIRYIIIDCLQEAIEFPKNVLGIRFNIYEAVYIAGIIAANTTQADKIGIIIDENIPVKSAYAAAFYAGILSQGKTNLEINGLYMDTIKSDADFAHAIANQLYAERHDIIFTVANNANIGVVESARNKDLYAICSDIDLSNNDIPGNVLASAVKNYNIIVHDLIREYLNNSFKGGETLILGLKENGVDIKIPNCKLPVSDETLNKIENAKEKIINGLIKIPSDENELLKDFPEINFMK